MKGFFENKFLMFSVIGGVIVVALIAFVLLSSSATTKAVVMNSSASSGTEITSDMVTVKDVPSGTPGTFYKSLDQVVGYKLTTNVKPDQLLYESDLMTSIEMQKEETPDEFITTSITLSNDQALGGLLTAGDLIDIAVVPDNVNALSKALPDFKIDTSNTGGFTYILSNVNLVDTTSAVSSESGSNMSTALNNTSSSTSSSSSYYLLSLSYNDYKKLMIAQQYGKIYFNLSPKQNKGNDPLIDQMTEDIKGGLTDAQLTFEESQNKATENKTSSSSSSSSSSNSGNSTSSGSSSENKSNE